MGKGSQTEEQRSVAPKQGGRGHSRTCKQSGWLWAKVGVSEGPKGGLGEMGRGVRP